MNTVSGDAFLSVEGSSEVRHAIWVSNYIGFTTAFLRQHIIRSFRCGVSSLGESCTITLTRDPVITEKRLEEYLVQAVFIFMRLDEGVRMQRSEEWFDFNIEQPYASNCADYADTCRTFVIFDAWKHDAGFDKTKKKPTQYPMVIRL